MAMSGTDGLLKISSIQSPVWPGSSPITIRLDADTLNQPATAATEFIATQIYFLCFIISYLYRLSIYLYSNCVTFLTIDEEHGPHQRTDQFDTEDVYPTIVPGFDEHSERFPALCERLRLPSAAAAGRGLRGRRPGVPRHRALRDGITISVPLSVSFEFRLRKDF
ncbi:hypothetical protein EVAR_40842_1 [Eumeta japonica]|uniref:Uncharacterized protein n=1 Tax=Eumeta variegata TaxID=151549 RepID=A0A4C1ZTF4_EUMVA|nr:hypothetical protein EVAR_40842_1 [Eumeta japonica]